jgi:hypothetical protein
MIVTLFFILKFNLFWVITEKFAVFCVWCHVDSPYSKGHWCLWTMAWRPQIPQWERNFYFRAPIKNEIYFLNCNFYIPDQFFSGSYFLHLTYERNGFSYSYTMGSGKRGHKIPLGARKRSFQWVIVCTICVLDKPRKKVS